MEFSNNIENYYQNKDIEFTKNPTNHTLNISKLDKLYYRLQKEYDYWEELFTLLKPNKNTPNNTLPLNNIRIYFEGLLQDISKASENNNINESDKKKTVDNLVNKLHTNSYPAVYSNSEFANMVENLINKYNSNVNIIDGFEKGYFNDNKLNFNTTELSNNSFYTGHFLGIKLRNPEIFNEKSESKIDEINAITEEFNSERNEFKREKENFEKSMNEEFQHFKEETNSKLSEFDEQVSTKSDNLDQLYNNSLENFNNLEKSYESHLKIEKPAKYWSKLATKYYKRADKWKWITIGTSIIYLALLVVILVLTAPPQNWNFDFESAKYTVILTVVISFGIFLINNFIRITNSNYHLANDAEERHHLTYFYLSLIRENGEFSSEEKNIVLQSLFRRTDTGLIKSDSSSNMPNPNSSLQFYSDLNKNH
ncbi:DUF6161 domain-containing protein [Alkalibacillus sp. S2W]|uniref:DUF6161 domain-containing protein n=1 Tax=Alkalibacillus sp. S2W TaxID=3386553 RepID=UPI00398CDBE9